MDDDINPNITDDDDTTSTVMVTFIIIGVVVALIVIVVIVVLAVMIMRSGKRPGTADGLLRSLMGRGGSECGAAGKGGGH